MMDQDVLMTPREAADFLGLSTRFLEVRRYRGGGPEYIRVSARCVRYSRQDLLSWCAERRRSSTSDPGPAGDER